MKVLPPKEPKTEIDGKFPCGRKSGLEQKEFRMPSNECEDCVIELEYSYGNTSAHYCADIVLLEQSPMPPLHAFELTEDGLPKEKDFVDECGDLCLN